MARPHPGEDQATELRQLPSDAVNRLWERLLYEDSIGLQRGNYFLVAESVLVVGYSIMLSSGDDATSKTPVGRAIAAFGLLLTIIWIYVGYRQRRYRDFSSVPNHSLPTGVLSDGAAVPRTSRIKCSAHHLRRSGIRHLMWALLLLLA